MHINDFDFDLPESLIAQYPLTNRTDSRLLSLNITDGTIEHQHFRDLSNKVMPGDLLVFNDTRVIPARLYAKKRTGGRVEILIERMLNSKQALAHVKANRAPLAGTTLLTGNFAVEVTGRRDDLFVIRAGDGTTMAEILQQQGHIPLPPYIDRADEATDEDRYQTVYSKHSGAVAAPTAGLHFDQGLLDELAAKGVRMAFVTLHVGAGTFQPVRVDNIAKHKMHAEYLSVSAACCRQIRQAKLGAKRVIAVGTTAVRALETAAARSADGIQPFAGDTQIFIYPGFRFRVVDAMITNFHLPKSTLLMLVSAFADRATVLNAYREAIAEKYRFFSYGDAMFLHQNVVVR